MLLVPAGEAPHKRIEPEPGAKLRLEMTRLAAAGDELLEVGELEVERDGPSYTFRTLELLIEQRPDDELTFLMGVDVAAHLEAWRSPQRVLELARLGIAGRPGTEVDEAAAAVGRLGAAARADFLQMPEIGVSSTLVRRRIAEGRPVAYLVPDAVAALIADHGLYRQRVAA